MQKSLQLRQLHNRLISDLHLLGTNLNFNLELKPYSKTYYGRYNPNKNKIILYIYQDSKCTKLYPYEKLLETAVHEYTHYVQYSDPQFERLKGVMHDSKFVILYRYYLDRIHSINLWKELRKVEKTCRGKTEPCLESA